MNEILSTKMHHKMQQRIFFFVKMSWSNVIISFCVENDFYCIYCRKFGFWLNFSWKKKNNSSTRNIANVHTFMILHWATPVTVSGTPCAVSTPSHIGFKVMTSSDRRWTSVTNHHAHAHPPTIVRFLVDPQHPPVKQDNNMNQWRWFSIFETYLIR